MSGVVHESRCEAFKVGDEVYGWALTGSLTEYTTTPCQTVGIKPKALSFEKAAALPVVIAAAYVGLRDIVKKGDTVLVIGAVGGCGSISVPLAKSLGAAKVL